MSNIKDITKLEKEAMKELQQYNEASLKVITDLNKKISKLESENAHLKSMLDSNIKDIALTTNDLTLGISNEQLICETQLCIIKNNSLLRELTTDEARRFEIYTNILDKIKAKSKHVDNLDHISEEDLIKVVKLHE